MELEKKIARFILEDRDVKIDTDRGIIVLPEPQRTGTTYQKETYARTTARDIINHYKLRDITRVIRYPSDKSDKQ